jgi:hypothetical protein
MPRYTVRYDLRSHVQAAAKTFYASIRALVALVDNSAPDSDFNLAHRRIRAARRACEVARDALEHHQAKHGGTDAGGDGVR